MARIPYPDLDALDPDISAFMGRIDPMLNVFHMMSHAEMAVRPFMRLGNALLFKGELDRKLQEIVILRAGHIAGSEYEVRQHRIVGRDCGLTEAQIDATAVGEASDAFDERQKLALRVTDEILANVRMSDATFEAAKAAFSHRELIELILTVGFYNMLAGMLVNLEVEPEPDGLIDNPLKQAKPAN